jgi:hypothetical protein
MNPAVTCTSEDSTVVTAAFKPRMNTIMVTKATGSSTSIIQGASPQAQPSSHRQTVCSRTMAATRCGAGGPRRVIFRV